MSVRGQIVSTYNIMSKGSHYYYYTVVGIHAAVSMEQISEFHADVNKLTREEEI